VKGDAVSVRKAVAALFVTPVLASVVLAGSAPPANADEPTISGGGVKTGQSARVAGNGGKVLGVPRLARLVLRGKEVARGKGPISYSFSTHSVPNGSYQASLQTSGVGLVWVTRGKTTLRLRAAPYTPSGVSAHRSGHTVTVHWAHGHEPDLTSYRVLSTSGSLGTLRSESAACSGSSCSATLRLPTGGSGSYGFAVRAYRSSGSGGTVGSAASGMHYVSLPAPHHTTAGSRTSPYGRSGGTPTTSEPSAKTPDGDYLPNGIGDTNPYLPKSARRSPLKLPSVGPSGFTYPTPDQPQVAAPPGKRHIADPSPSPMAEISPLDVGVAAALGGLLVIAHLLARWRLRLVAAKSRDKAAARAANASGRGHAWETAAAWSRSAARKLKRAYHHERRRH
jgi:hypothetical protein